MSGRKVKGQYGPTWEIDLDDPTPITDALKDTEELLRIARLLIGHLIDDNAALKIENVRLRQQNVPRYDLDDHITSIMPFHDCG